MWLVGAFLGGVAIIWLIAALLEWLVIRHVFNDPVNGKATAVLVAWLFCGTVAGFGMANGGPFYVKAYLVYAPSAVAVAIFFVRRGLQIRDDAQWDEPQP